MPFNTYQDPTSAALLSGQAMRQGDRQDSASAALARGNVQRQALRSMERSKDRDREHDRYLARLEVAAKSHFQRADQLHEQAMQTGKIGFLREALAEQAKAFKMTNGLNRYKAESAVAYMMRKLGGDQDAQRKVLDTLNQMLEYRRQKEAKAEALKGAKAATEAAAEAEKKAEKTRPPGAPGEPEKTTARGTAPAFFSDEDRAIFNRGAEALKDGKTLESVGVEESRFWTVVDKAKTEYEALLAKAEKSIGGRGGKPKSAAGGPWRMGESAVRAAGVGDFFYRWFGGEAAEESADTQRESQILHNQGVLSDIDRLIQEHRPAEGAQTTAGQIAEDLIFSLNSGQDPVASAKERLHATVDGWRADPETASTGQSMADLLEMPSISLGGTPGGSPKAPATSDLFLGGGGGGGSPVVQAGESKSPVTMSGGPQRLGYDEDNPSPFDIVAPQTTLSVQG